MIVVCTGETHAGLRSDALDSLAKPVHVATMEPQWWEAAEACLLPRLWFNDKLALMKFCLGRKCIMLAADDGDEVTHGMMASFHAMGVRIWKVQHMEEAM